MTPRSSPVTELADALERADWSGVSIGNKVMLKGAIDALRGVAQAAAHDAIYLRGWNEGIERAAEFLDDEGSGTPAEKIRTLLEVSPHSSTLHSPPEFLAPHNSGEMLPKREPAGSGGETSSVSSKPQGGT